MARPGPPHQWEGRPVDAMLCFRQAARLEARAPDPRFHLGEVLWQLGRLPAAAAAWREATAIAPAHVAAWTAIAEASLAGGEYATAHEAALRVLALTPGDARAEAIAGITWLAAGGEGAAIRIAAAFDAAPALIGVPTVAGPLALVVAAAPTPDTDALLATLAPRSPRRRSPRRRRVAAGAGGGIRGDRGGGAGGDRRAGGGTRLRTRRSRRAAAARARRADGGLAGGALRRALCRRVRLAGAAGLAARGRPARHCGSSCSHRPLPVPRRRLPCRHSPRCRRERWQEPTSIAVATPPPRRRRSVSAAGRCCR